MIHKIDRIDGGGRVHVIERREKRDPVYRFGALRRIFFQVAGILILKKDPFQEQN